MWNCKFVWHVVVSTWTKFPTCGSLPLPFVPFTRLHTRYFPTSCLLVPLVSRFTLTQPKSSSWHLLIVITASPLTQVLCHWRLRWIIIPWWLFQTGKGFLTVLGFREQYIGKRVDDLKIAPKWTWFSEGRKYINSPLLWVYNEAVLFLHHPILSVKESMRGKSHW